MLTIIQSVHPEWLGNHRWILPAAVGLFSLSLLYFLLQFGWVQYIFGLRSAEKRISSSPSTEVKNEITGSLNPTATAAVGNITIINSSIDPDEIAESVAQKLKRDEQTESILQPGDGFVQLEDTRNELQIPSMPLQPGQTFSLKYWYSNRGALPVYDVQTWGLLHILAVELNAGEHLKQVMRDAAKEGYERFPDKGTTLGVGIEHYSIAALLDPLTDAQVLGVRQGVLALFFVVGGVWRDNKNRLHYWSEGRMAEIPHFPDLSEFRWKGL